MTHKTAKKDEAETPHNPAIKPVAIVLSGLAIMLLAQLVLHPLGASDDIKYGSFLFGLLMVVGGIFYAVISTMAFDENADAEMKKIRLEGSYIEKLDAPQELNGIPIGNAVMPRQAEPLHMLIEGAPGTGKTQILKRMLQKIRSRGDTFIVVDSNYDMHKDFFRNGDIVVSPFDENAQHWLPQNEIRTSTDWDALAQSFIGDGQGSAQQWHQMAKAFFASTARGYQSECRKAGEPFDHRELFYLLTQAPPEAVAPFLKGSAASALGDNEKGLQNVRMTFFNTLKSWEYLQEGQFSFRDWVESGLSGNHRPSLFLPYKSRDIAIAKNLISCWLDQIITSAIDGGENRNNRVWIIIDELSGLGEIAGLKQAVAQLRKTGFCVVVGIQAMEQVEDIYGRNGAISITASLGNKVMLRTADSQSAERQSRLIGDARYSITQTSQSFSRTQGDRSSSSNKATSTSTREEVQRVMLASEIMALPDLTAIVHWAGSECWYLTKIPVFQKSQSSQVEIIRPAETTQDLEIKNLQERLKKEPAIEAKNFMPEAYVGNWGTVDTLLQRIGGKDWSGLGFRDKIISILGHQHGNQDLDRIATAYESARQILIKTTDRSAIEQASNGVKRERENVSEQDNTETL